AIAWLLWLAVAAWVAGFDVLYAVLDIEFDRANGVHSIPADLGLEGALWVTGILYALAVAALVLVGAPFESAAGQIRGLAWPFAAALVVMVLLLGEQHRQLRKHRDARVLDSFNANMIIGPLILLGTVLGLALR